MAKNHTEAANNASKILRPKIRQAVWVKFIKKRGGAVTFWLGFLLGATLNAAFVIPALTNAQTKAVADAFKARFNSWWSSWVEPELEYLAKRGK